MRTKVALLAASVMLYLVVKYLVPYGGVVLYPLVLLVTVFHELGHAGFALLTGGTVHGVQINPDGSGFAQISGGLFPLVAMGGYVGSAFFGNLLIVVGLTRKRLALMFPWLLAALLLFTAVYWFQAVLSSIILLLFAAALIGLAKKFPKRVAPVLAFLGCTSVLYITEDFNGGPTSDLAMFAEAIPLLPAAGWAVIWLIVVLAMTWMTLRRVFKRRGSRPHNVELASKNGARGRL